MYVLAKYYVTNPVLSAMHVGKHLGVLHTETTTMEGLVTAENKRVLFSKGVFRLYVRLSFPRKG